MCVCVCVCVCVWDACVRAVVVRGVRAWRWRACVCGSCHRTRNVTHRRAMISSSSVVASAGGGDGDGAFNVCVYVAGFGVSASLHLMLL